MATGQALVREAMTRLKLMRKGATLAQIKRQIESNYSGKVDIKKRGLLTTALKGLLEKGQVEKKGANYKLAQVAKLKENEDELGVPARRYRRKHHGGGRRAHHRRRHHRRRRSKHLKRRRHHRRRGRHHKRRRHSRRRRRDA